MVDIGFVLGAREVAQRGVQAPPVEDLVVLEDRPAGSLPGRPWAPIHGLGLEGREEAFREEGDWSATFGTREIGKHVPLSTDDHFRVGSEVATMLVLASVRGSTSGEALATRPRGGFPHGNGIGGRGAHTQRG